MLRQVGRDYQDQALTWGPALGTTAAAAHLRIGEFDQAAESLEAGRAQLLSATLRRDGADLARIRAAGGEDLADRYVSALLRLGAAGREEVPDVAAQNAQEELESAVQRIRSLDGLGDFLLPLKAQDLQEVARQAEAIVLYLAEADPAGLAVVVGDSIEGTLPPGLSHAAAREHLQYLVAEPGSPAHAAGLERACTWLGEALCGVVDNIPPTDVPDGRIVIVRCGLLSLLPIHAARTADGRYLFDEYDVRYVANVEALRASLRSAGAPLGSAAIVAGPTPDAGEPLPYARFEAALVETALTRRGATVTQLRGPGAARTPVLDQLGTADLVHVACHAVTETDEPLTSGLVLAGRERLTLEDLERGRVTARLVVLSACETASTDQRLPDEVVSLPSSLLAAGCGGAIGSLWKVDDRATAILMLETYDGIGAGLAPAVALTRARRRLREATNAELLDRVRCVGQGSHEPGYRALVTSLALADPQDRDFASPVHWAAFEYIGG